MDRRDLSGATNDEQLIELWLIGRAEGTVRVYRQAIEAFREALPTPVRELTIGDVLRWSDELTGRDATRARHVATVKSLLTFAWRTGYTPVNVGRALRCVKVADDLHERILDEDTIKTMIAKSRAGRDRSLVRLLYGAGLRLNEALRLRAIDVGPNRVSVLGKGKKTRTVGIPADLAKDLLRLKRDDGPLFRTFRGAPLQERAAREIIYKIADEAAIEASPHWLRHAHASHALDHGAPIHVVQRSLGHANVSTTSRYLHIRPGVSSGDFLPQC